MKYCPNCGAQIDDKAVVCVKCGVAQPGTNSPSNSEWLTVLLLCIFLGGLGIHRFYVGKTGTGIAQLLTCGGCGIWALIDLIMILTGGFEDANGNKITNK
ncbi:MAG: NINE protein [Alistipes sp.]|nr:NINE protein [Alistipes sp.]